MVLGLMTKKISPSPTRIGGLDFLDSWTEIRFIQIRLFGLLDTLDPQPSQITVRHGLIGCMGCFVESFLYGFLKPFTQGVNKDEYVKGALLQF